MSAITLKIVSSRANPEQVSIQPGQGRHGQPMHVLARAGNHFQLLQGEQGKGPHHFVAKRVGHELHLSFGEGDTEADANQPDLVIDHYYDEQCYAPLTAQGPDGHLHAYMAESSNTLESVPGMVDSHGGGAGHRQLLSENTLGTDLCLAPFVGEFGGMGGMGWLVGALGAGLVAGGQKHDTGPDPYLVQVQVMMGQVQDGVRVALYDRSGHKLGESAQVVKDGNSYTVQVTVTNGYKGEILAVVVDANSTAPNYLDETSGALKDMNLTAPLRALATGIEALQVGGGVVPIVITPLTELALQKAGVASGGQVAQGTATAPDTIPALDASQVAQAAQADAALANLFGVTGAGTKGLQTLPVVTTSAAFDASTPAGHYGLVLATLSGADTLAAQAAQAQGASTTGVSGQTVATLAAGITIDAATGTASFRSDTAAGEAARALLVNGAIEYDNGTTGGGGTVALAQIINSAQFPPDQYNSNLKVGAAALTDGHTSIYGTVSLGADGQPLLHNVYVIVQQLDGNGAVSGVTSLGPLTVDAQGHYDSGAISLTADGHYNIFATGQSDASSFSPVGEAVSPIISFVNTPSLPPSYLPVAAQVKPGGATPPVLGVGEPGAEVEVIFPNGEVQTTTVNAQGTWSVTPDTAQPEGSNSASVTQTLGETVSRVAVMLDIDTVSPAGQTGSQDAASDTGVRHDNLTADNTPVISGQAEPHVVVAVTVAGNTFTTLADASGHYQVSIPGANALADGTYMPEIRATDAAGNTSVVDGTPFTIDTTAPSAAGALTAVAPNDTGALGDSVTQTTTPALSGTTEPGSTVSVVVDGQTLTATADASGAWSMTAAALADGVYTPAITVTDPAGNSATTDGTPFTVDTTAPVAAGTLTAVAPNDTGALGDSVTQTTAPALSGTTEPGSAVSVVVGGQTLTATADAAGAWSVTAAALADGTYTPAITVTDPAGNSATADGTPFTIDTTAPAVASALTAVTPNDSGALGDGVTQTTTPALSGTTEPGSAVSVVVDGQTLTATADAAGEWSVTAAALADGAYTPAITVIDPAGNSATADGTPFTVDTTAPAAVGTLTAVAPHDTGTLGDNVTQTTAPAVSGTTQAGSAVSVVVGGQTLTATANAAGAWSVTAATLADGVYTPVITVTDPAGNSATANGTPFKIDTTAPAATGALTAVAPNDTGVLGDNVTSHTAAALSGTTQPGSAVSVVVGGQTLTATANAAGAWSVTAATLADGAYTPVITVTDPAGNSATANGTPFTVDTTTPAVAGALTAVAPNDSGALGDNVTSHAAAALSGTTQPGSAISVVVGGQTLTSTADAAGAWSVTAATLADGAYTPVITVTDLAGNVFTASGTPFTVDTTTPAVAGALTAVASNDSGVLGDNITSHAVAALSGTTQAGSAVSVVVGGQTLTATADAAGAWSVTAAALAEGAYTPVITVTDPAGNSASANGTPFTVDTTAPVVAGALTAVAPNDTGALGDNITSHAAAALSGTTQPGSAISVVVGGQTLTATADAAGAWSVTAAALADGVYTPVITVADPAGNSAFANGTPFTIDTTAPAVAGALSAVAPNDTSALGDNVTSHTAAALSGTTQAGSAVSVVVGGQTLTATADAAGAWSVTAATLADGVFTPVITVTDPAGNSATANGTPFTVDTTTPAVTGALIAVAPNDSGALGDNVTSHAAAALSGTTQPSSAVSVVVGGQTLTATADAAGAWSVTAATLADGVYTPVITVTDLAGNAFTASGTPFTVDTTTPAVAGALTAAAPNDSAVLGDNLTNHAAAALSGTTQAGSAVSVVVGGQTLTATADAAGAWSVTAAALADGAYTPVITVTDPAGNSASASGTPFTVDTTTPAVAGALTAVVPNDTGALGDNVTSHAAAALSGTTQAGSAVSVVVGGQTLTATADAVGAWSVTATTLADGVYTPVITVTDPAGNSTFASGTPFTIDTTASAVAGALTAVAPNDSATLGDNITRHTAAALSGTTQPGSAISVVVGGQTLTATADAAGAWSATAATLADGVYTPVITVTDPAGNSASANGTPFTVDTTAPVVAGALTAVAPNDTSALGDNVTSHAAAVLSGTTQPGSAVSVVVGGQTLTATAGAAGDWSVTAATLADGAYTPVITVTDPAGNSAFANGTPFTVDTTAPAVAGALTAVAPNDSGALGDNITSHAAVALTGTTQPGSAISVVVGGQTLTATADAAGAWSVTATTLADGAYTPVITVTDLAGNSASASGTPFTVDTTTPAAAGALTAVAPNDSAVLGDNLTNHAAAALSGTTQPDSAVSVVVGGQTLTATADAAGTWSVTAATLADGVYTPVITVTDPAGNSASANGTPFTVHTTAPAVVGALTAVAPNDSATLGDNITSHAAVALTGTTQPGSAISVVVGGQTLTATANAAGAWSVTATTLADGAYTPVITVTDPAGNSASASGTLFTVDTTAPAVVGALTAVAPNDSGVLGDNVTSHAAAALSGTTQPGSAVSVVVGGQTLTATADAAGAWSVMAATLADGVYTPVITVTDPAGNSASANGTPFTVDTTTPVVAGALTAVAPNDTGALGDNITSHAAAALSGTTQPGSAVSVVVGGQTLTATADAAGAWSVTAAALADGAYTPVITVTDPAGNSATANGTSLRVDTTAPVVAGALTALAPNDTGPLGDNLTSLTTPEVSGVTEAYSAVSVLLDGYTYTTVADASGHWAITSSLLSSGTYTPTITITDQAGNVASSNGVSFTVFSPPSISGAVSASSTEDVTTPTTVSLLQGANSANGYAMHVTGVTYTVNGVATTNGGTDLPAGVTIGGNTLTIDTADPTFDRLTAGSPETVVAHYTIDDAHGGSVAQTATVVINGVNDAPVLTQATMTAPSNIWPVSTLSSSTTYSLPATNGVPGPGQAPPGWAMTGGTPDITDQVDGAYGFPGYTLDGVSGTTIDGGTVVGAIYMAGYIEQVSTTLTGLTPGQQYTVGVQWQEARAHGPSGDDYAGGGILLHTASGASAQYSESLAYNQDTWKNAFLTFTATGTSETLMVEPTAGLANESGSTGNFIIWDALSSIQLDNLSITQGAGSAISNFMPSVTDADLGSSLHGYAVTSAAASGADHWEYYNGSSWMPLSGASTSSATFLTPSTLVRWNGSSNSHTALSAIAVDDTSSAVLGTTLNVSIKGGTTPYSSTAATLAAGIGPVALDLDHDGAISYVSSAMDVNTDGTIDHSAWVGGQDGVLVWDKFHDGIVHDQSQYAFSQYGGTTDLTGLRAFDTNHDGQLDAGDAAFSEFKVWQDTNGDGISNAGEVKSLTEWGIASIALTSDGVNAQPANGVTEFGHAVVTMADGSTAVAADAMFDYSAINMSTLLEVTAEHSVIDLTSSSAQTAHISLADVLQNGQAGLLIDNGAPQIVVNAGPEDVVQLAGSSSRVSDVNAGGATYSAWDLDGNGRADVFVSSHAAVLANQEQCLYPQQVQPIL